MTTNLTVEQIEIIQNKIYDDNFKKPSIPIALRKNLNLFTKRASTNICILTSKNDLCYQETLKSKSGLKSGIEIIVKSYKECTSTVRLVREPASMRDYNNFRFNLRVSSDRYTNEHYLDALEVFMNSIERMLDKDYNFTCERFNEKEFYFAVESDAFKISFEIFINF